LSSEMETGAREVYQFTNRIEELQKELETITGARSEL